MVKDKYFIYPKDVSAFGFDWGKLSLTVAPEVNGQPVFRRCRRTAERRGPFRHNHHGAEEIIL